MVRHLFLKKLLRERQLVLLAFSFLVLRLGILLTGAESVSWDMREELYRGTIAKEVIQGLKVPIWDYQGDNFDGGSLWIGVLAVPFYILLGPIFFALKLVPLLFSFAVFLLSFHFFKRFFDNQIALWVSAFLLLPPTVFTVLSLWAAGAAYAEPILFTVAMLFSLYEFLYRGGKPVFLFLFGLAAGLGFWFSSITFITLITCLTSWFLLNRRSFLSRYFLIFLVAFAIGLLPFVFYNATHEKGLLDFLQSSFLWGGGYPLEAKLKSVPFKMGRLVSETLPLIFRFRSVSMISGNALTVLYGLLFWLLVLPFFWQEGRRDTKSLPFLLYPFFFILFYSLSNFPLPLPTSYTADDFRYFGNFYFFAFSLLALSLGNQKRRGLFLTLLLGMGLLGQGSLLFQEPPGRAFHYRGYSYLHLGEVWAKYVFSFPKKFNEFERVASRFPELEQRFLYWGFSNRIDYPKDWRALWDAKRMMADIDRVPPPYRRYFLDSWGASLCSRMKHFFNDYRFASLDFEQRISRVATAIPEPDRPYFYQGLFRGQPMGYVHSETGECLYAFRDRDPSYQNWFYFSMGRSLGRSLRQRGWNEFVVGVLDSLPDESRIWVWRGVGDMAAAFWVNSVTLRNFNPVKTRIPPDGRAEFFWGVGWGIAHQMAEDRTRAEDWLKRLPRENQASAWEGLMAFEKRYGLSPRE